MLDVRALLPGAAVLVVAVVIMMRPGRRSSPQEAPGSDDGATGTAELADGRAKDS